jgi:hypothetical protein
MLQRDVVQPYGPEKAPVRGGDDSEIERLAVAAPLRLALDPCACVLLTEGGRS